MQGPSKQGAFCGSWLVFATVLLRTPTVAGADDDARVTDARQAFATGTEAYQNMEFGRALQFFEEAYRLRPSYRIQFNIAQTQLELSKPHLALEAFEKYLSDGQGEIDASRRSEVLLEIRKLRNVVGEIVVMGKTGAECRIDDEHVSFLPMNAPVRLEAGPHALTLHFHGEVICRKMVKIVPGKKRIDQCRTQDELGGGPEPESVWDVMSDTSMREYDLAVSVKQPAPAAESGFLKVAPWIVSGLAVATLSTGSVLALKTSSLNSELKGACDDNVCGSERQDDVDKLPRLAVGADIMFIATSVFTATAISLFIVRKKRRVASEQQPNRTRPADDDFLSGASHRIGGDW
ncbi:MAG: hypothetical protein JXR76_15665 [Deltaproteobacteria bacterium]|nr:hypothetical protein [Deltaproteobacteria bacterium]